MQMFSQFWLRTRAFYTWHVLKSPYSSFGRINIDRTDHFLRRNDAKAFRRSSAYAIAVVVTLRSSSFEYTVSVHAGAERNVCYIEVSTETPHTTNNPSQTLLPVYKLAHLPLPLSKFSPPRPQQPLAQPFAQMRYRCQYQVSSTGPNALEVYIIYLHVHVYMCQYFVTYRMCRGSE